jgi:hypothetical protein
MNRKRLTLRLVVVAFLGGACGFVLTFSGGAKSQEAGLTPFTAHLVEKMYGSADDTAPHIDHISFGRRSDGSEATYRTMKSPDGQQDGQLGSTIDLGRAESLDLEPFTRSVTTLHYSLDELGELKDRLQAKGCPADMDKLGEHTKMLGHEVVRIRESHSTHLGTETDDKWVAPDLGCFALAETATFAGPRNVTTVTSLTEGEPPLAMFAVPSDYVERSPSQLSAEWTARFGHKYWGEDNITTRMDKRYYAHR